MKKTVTQLSEVVFLNLEGAQESIPRIDSASLCSPAGQYDNPIPTRFIAPIDCSKIPAQDFQCSRILLNGWMRPHCLKYV
jgi:hypothetical protein